MTKNTGLSEREIEAYLVKKVREVLHGRAYKFISPGNNGVPDRIVVLPGGRIIFVELKREGGGKLSPMQKAQQAKLSLLGCQVISQMNSKQQVDGFIYAEAERQNAVTGAYIL